MQSISKNGHGITVNYGTPPDTNHNTTNKDGHYAPSAKDSSYTAGSGKYISKVHYDSKHHVTGISEGTLPVNTDTNHNTTNETGHYTPSVEDTSKKQTNSTWNHYIKAIKLDSKHHVVGIETGSPYYETNTDTHTDYDGHYAPSGGNSTGAGSTSTGNGATVVTSITKDGKGHITNVGLGKLSIPANTDTNYYLNGVSGNGNGTVTFDMAGGKADITWNAKHTHNDYLPKTGGTITGSLNGPNNSWSINSNGSAAFTDSLYIGDNDDIMINDTHDGGICAIGPIHAKGFYDDSDNRLKNFKENIEVDFDKLKNIPKKYFTWKKDGEDGKLNIGTSAQEVQKIYPEIVSEGKDGYLSVDYSKLSVIALKAVDKLNEENEKLKEQLSSVNDEIRMIKEKLGL